MYHLDYPYHINNRGRSAATTDDRYVRNLIEQLLFTMPGERVNRPEFGTGLMQLIHGPNSDEIATATQFLVQSGLQRWLGEWVQVEDVTVESSDARLVVTVQYVVRKTQQRTRAEFVREV